MTYNIPHTNSTIRMEDVEGIGTTVAIRFVDKYGEDSLDEISRIAKESPEKLLSIKDVGPEMAENLRQRMIDAEVYVPQSGELITDEDLEETERRVEVIIDSAWGEKMGELASESDYDLRLEAKKKHVPCHPSKAHVIAPSIAERIVNDTDYSEYVVLDESETVSEDEFEQELYDAIERAWGERMREMAEDVSFDAMMPVREENIPLDGSGVAEAMVDCGRSLIYGVEGLLDPFSEGDYDSEGDYPR